MDHTDHTNYLSVRGVGMFNVLLSWYLQSLKVYAQLAINARNRRNIPAGKRDDHTQHTTAIVACRIATSSKYE